MKSFHLRLKICCTISLKGLDKSCISDEREFYNKIFQNQQRIVESSEHGHLRRVAVNSIT